MPNGCLFFLLFILIIILVLVIIYYVLRSIFSKDSMESEKRQELIQLSTCIILVGCLVLIPVFLNWFISELKYEKWHIHSAMGPGDWFAFLGSYMGVAGTVVIGLISLKQAHMLDKKDKLLARLQAEPRIRITTVSAFLWHSKTKMGILQKEELERIYFIQYGEKKKIKEDQKNYLILALEIEDVGILPIEKIEIYEIIWRVHDRSFVIDLEKDKLKNIDLLHEIYLVADEEDNIDDAGEFFHELFRHFSFIT